MSFKNGETALADEAELERRFERYFDGLPAGERPASNLQVWRMFGEWENEFKEELGGWKMALDELEKRPLDKEKIFTSARNKVMHLLQRQAEDDDLWPGNSSGSPTNGNETNKGRKGYEILSDYVIPVIKHMKSGKSHTDAFRLVATVLNVHNTTARAQCTRGLGLNIEEFKEHVRTGRIVQIMKNKFPERNAMIDRDLGPLYP